MIKYKDWNFSMLNNTLQEAIVKSEMTGEVIEVWQGSHNYEKGIETLTKVYPDGKCEWDSFQYLQLIGETKESRKEYCYVK